jgi:alanine-glyoxylate transaminase / serine-glyoxylate transaminase / serine-pyruvate transaminase
MMVVRSPFGNWKATILSSSGGSGGQQALDPGLFLQQEVFPMAGRNHLFVPGPTNVPDRVLRAMHRAMEDHRSSDFPALAAPVLEDLKKVFKTTSGQAFIFPSSGTGAWEASLTNTLSPGDKVLAARFGMFSQLWIDMAQRFGLQVDILDVDWGEGAPIERYQEALAADKSHRIKAVLFTHNETATGVTSDVAGIRRALNDTRHPALLMVDGVSSIGSIDFRMDEWGVDLAVTGSQKGFMLPAGLGMVCVSQKALAACEQAKLPRVFFDFGDMRKANATGYFPYTPSLPLLYGLRESLAILFEEGLENVFARHHRLAEGTRQAVKAWGLELCARSPKWYSDTVSAIMVPGGINGAEVIDVAYRRYNLALGAGLARMAGKLFRIGHLGDLNELMLATALVGAEMAMRDVGVKVTPGSGVAAAEEYWRSTAAPLSKRELPARAPDDKPAAAPSKEKATAGAGR